MTWLVCLEQNVVFVIRRTVIKILSIFFCLISYITCYTIVELIKKNEGKIKVKLAKIFKPFSIYRLTTFIEKILTKNYKIFKTQFNTPLFYFLFFTLLACWVPFFVIVGHKYSVPHTQSLSWYYLYKIYCNIDFRQIIGHLYQSGTRMSLLEIYILTKPKFLFLWIHIHQIITTHIHFHILSHLPFNYVKRL